MLDPVTYQQKKSELTQQINTYEQELAAAQGGAEGVKGGIATLKAEIKALMAAVADDKDQVKHCREEVAKYSHTAKAVQKRITEFGDMVQSRREKLDGIAQMGGSVKAAAGYTQQVGAFLNGAKYKQTSSGLQEADAQVGTKIKGLDAQLDSLQKDIKALDTRIAADETKLRTEKAKLDRHHSDIAFYQNKISEARAALVRLEQQRG
jgi:peptidoglycan hydrolase CwlO-like protein